MELILKLLPSTAFGYAIFFVGIVFGIILTITGIKRGVAGEDEKATPLFKSIWYGLVGLVLVLFADWGDLLKQENIGRIEVVGFYVIGFVFAFLATLILLIFSITIRVVRLRNTNYASQWTAPLTDLFFYGYDYVNEKLADEISHNEKIKGLFGLWHAHSLALTACTVDIEKYLEEPAARKSKQSFNRVCQRVLENIITSATPYIRDGNDDNDFYLNVNYMLAVPFENATDDEKNNIVFSWDAVKDKYKYLLVLKQYANQYDATVTNLSLPVVNTEEHPELVESILPGAPLAFLEKGHKFVGQDIEFKRDIPKEIQEDITKYMRNKNFECFISLNIPITRTDNTHTIIGIVNIETNRSAIVNASPEERKQLTKIIEPFCALLGLLLKCEEHGNA